MDAAVAKCRETLAGRSDKPMVDRIRALVTANDVRVAWDALALSEQRKIIKAAFDIRVQQTKNRGQNAFEPERVLIEPRLR